MKKFFPILFTIVLFACSSADPGDRDSLSQEENEPAASADGLKAGGLYLSQNADSTWSVTKVLVLDNFAAHIRMYSDTFKTKPADVNSKDLNVFIGHAPLDRKGFLIDKPELLKVEPVKDEELEGYKMYLEAMQGN
jgi:hypothetical protein